MRRGTVLGNECGFIRFLFTTALLIFAVYVGILFGIPFYKQSAFRSDVKELARISLGDVEKTRTQVIDRARELKIPIDEKAIQVTRTEKTIRVRASWKETVDVLGVYQKTLSFSVDEEE